MLYRLPSKQNIVALSCDFWWVIGSYFKPKFTNMVTTSAPLFALKGRQKKRLKLFWRLTWILITKKSPLDKRELRDAAMFQFVVISARFLVYYACITWENNDIANRSLQTKSFSCVSFNFIERIEVDGLSVGE